jgi:hypothetical protein
MDALTYLKDVKNLGLHMEEGLLIRVAKYMQEYANLVTTAKNKTIKKNIAQMMDTDMAIKNMTVADTEKQFFLGKENAYRHISRIIDDVEKGKVEVLSYNMPNV